jgi:hypothetical protein
LARRSLPQMTVAKERKFQVDKVETFGPQDLIQAPL